MEQKDWFKAQIFSPAILHSQKGTILCWINSAGGTFYNRSEYLAALQMLTSVPISPTHYVKCDTSCLLLSAGEPQTCPSGVFRRTSAYITHMCTQSLLRPKTEIITPWDDNIPASHCKESLLGLSNMEIPMGASLCNCVVTTFWSHRKVGFFVTTQ